MLGNVNKVEQFGKRSENAIGVFKKTIADLAGVNSGIDTEIAKKEKVIEDARKEKTQLSDLKVRNTKFINKINEFLEV